MCVIILSAQLIELKRRQNFRPFAPAILSEYANEYFEGPMNEYMQFVAQAKHDYSSVTHVDNSARVQIVTEDNPSILRPILEEYYERTGVPMLLNTSLNIKGQPIVDNWQHAMDFQKNVWSKGILSTTILFGGCSFTNGLELLDRRKTRYATHVCREFGALQWNEAKVGGGNDYIQRTIFNAILQGRKHWNIPVENIDTTTFEYDTFAPPEMEKRLEMD